MTSIDVIVATVGRAHGLRGEVLVQLRTDQPEDRLAVGAVFVVPTAEGDSTLTVAATRIQQERWYVRFAEVGDRTAAEALRGTELVATVDAEQEAEEDPDAWFPAQLTGLRVRDLDGHELGEVVGLEHYPGQDLLIVRTADRRRVQLPLVEQLVPEVDVDRGVVVADPPGGLFAPREETDDPTDSREGA